MRTAAQLVSADRALDEALREFHAGTLHGSRIDFYAIPDAVKFHQDDASAAEVILEQCREVQLEIWNPRHAIYENAIAPGLLVLAMAEGRIVGFFSARTFPCGEAGLGLFYSDMMISRRFQGLSLPSPAFQLLEEMTIQRANGSERGIVNVLATGNLALFSYLVRSSWLKQIPFRDISDFPSQVRDLLGSEFPGSEPEAGGIIRGAWKRQRSERNQWPRAIAQRWDFPDDVSYDAGDVLVRCFEFPHERWDSCRFRLKSRLDRAE